MLWHNKYTSDSVEGVHSRVNKRVIHASYTHDGLHYCTINK